MLGQLDIPATMEILRDGDVWICDTGASSHSTNDNLGAANVKESGSASLGHTGSAVKATCTIDLPGQFAAKDGSPGMKATLTDVSYNKEANFNLLSLTRLLMSGWKIISGDTAGIVIGNDNGEQIRFDIVIPTPRGAIMACRFVRDAEIQAVSTDAGTSMSIQKAHGLLGHGDEESTRRTAKQLGWIITRGKLKPCLYCATSKAKQKNTCKKSESPKAEEPGERIFLDLSKVTVPRADGTGFEINAKWWKSMVDEATGKKWADFTPSKSAMVERTCEFMNVMKNRKIPIKTIRLDPAGENLKLEKRAQSAAWQSLQPVSFEFTSRDTPQHNSLAEVSFPYLAGKARAMMSAAHVPDTVRGHVAVEAIKCAVQLDGLRVVSLKGTAKTRDEHVYGCNPKWAVNLRTFGEAGVV